MAKPGYKTIGVRVSDEMHDMLHRVAANNDCSVGYVVKMALQDVYPVKTKDKMTARAKKLPIRKP